MVPRGRYDLASMFEYKYSCTANVWRGFADIGELWREIGASSGRPDVTAHATELLNAAYAHYARC